MPSVLPFVSSGASCLYPLTRSNSFDTAIIQSYAGTEQRWKRRGALSGFGLQYTAITAVDKNTLNTFFANAKGAFDTTWTFPLSGSLLTNGYFSQGTVGWTVTAQSGWTYAWSATSGPSGAAAVTCTLGSTTIAGNGSTGEFVASPHVACTNGQTFDVTYFVRQAGSPPSGVAISTYVSVGVYNSGNTLLTTLGGFDVISGTQAWQQQTTSFTVTQSTAAYFIVSLIAGAFNNNGSTATITSGMGINASFANVTVTNHSQSGTYTNCTFEADDFAFTQTASYPDRWNGTVKFRQTVGGGQISAATGISSFPHIRSGILTTFPYAASAKYFTERNDLPAGPRYAYAYYGAGLTGFPSRGLMGWGLSFTNVTDADVATIESHFLGCGGRYLTFPFTDPDTSVAYPNVRYDMDTLDITHNGPGISSFKVTLAEFAG